MHGMSKDSKTRIQNKKLNLIFNKLVSNHKLKYMKLLLLLIFIYCAIGKDIILFAGIGNWSDQYLYNQYSAYRAYANMEMINTASILTYFLNTDGMMGVYQSDIDNHTCEEFQYTLKKRFWIESIAMFVLRCHNWCLFEPRRKIGKIICEKI